VVSQIERFIKRFVVFQERSARPCESVDWIQSYDADPSVLVFAFIHLRQNLP
jgi:hypothetical protein